MCRCLSHCLIDSFTESFKRDHNQFLFCFYQTPITVLSMYFLDPISICFFFFLFFLVVVRFTFHFCTNPKEWLRLFLGSMRFLSSCFTAAPSQFSKLAASPQLFLFTDSSINSTPLHLRSRSPFWHFPCNPILRRSSSSEISSFSVATASRPSSLPNVSAPSFHIQSQFTHRICVLHPFSVPHFSYLPCIGKKEGAFE